MTVFVSDSPEYARYVRLADMMVAFLRGHGKDYDADFAQQMLEGDGPGLSVEMAVDAIVDSNLEPPRDMIVLFGQVHDEDPMCDEEYERFREYLREREEERVKQRG